MHYEYINEGDPAPEVEGMRIACVSNAGLPPGKLRITYLPNDAFTDNPTETGEL